MLTFVRVATVCVAAAVAAPTLDAGPAPAASDVLLGIAGRANSTPWIAASGPFVAIAWGASASDRTDVLVAVSRDAGRTFGAPIQVNTIEGEARLGGEFPPRVALARVKVSADPEIVVLWTARGTPTSIKTSRSKDGGRSFETPTTLQAAGVPGDRGWPSLALDARGTAHALWLDHRGLVAGRSSGAAHQRHGAAGAAPDGVAMAMKSALYYAGGRRPTERQLTTGVCYCCKTALAAGPGGALYAAWRHVFPDNVRDIAFTSSRDNGRTFAAPVRVSEDGWQIAGCPDDGPALAVDAEGAVHVVWPTVTGGSEPQGAIFYANTRDGRAFSPRVRVPTLGAAKPGRPQIAVTEAGTIAIAWDESREGRRVAAVRALRQGTGTGPAFGKPLILADGAAAYPVLASTKDGVVAAWTSGSSEASRIAVRRLVLR